MIIPMRAACWDRQPEQDIESRIGVFQWHNGESTLVGHIGRVKAEDFAGAVHDLPDRNRGAALG
jgi:hypothetical protein